MYSSQLAMTQRLILRLAQVCCQSFYKRDIILIASTDDVIDIYKRVEGKDLVIKERKDKTEE